MTYRRLLDLTNGFLTGDNSLPDDPDVCLALLEDAFIEVADRAEALHLMTVSKDANALRLSIGDYVIRFPNLPTDLDDEVDIDEELCGAVGRFMAGYVSKEKTQFHNDKAERRILNYNGKVGEIFEKMANDALMGVGCES